MFWLQPTTYMTAEAQTLKYCSYWVFFLLLTDVPQARCCVLFCNCLNDCSFRAAQATSATTLWNTVIQIKKTSLLPERLSSEWMNERAAHGFWITEVWLNRVTDFPCRVLSDSCAADSSSVVCKSDVIVSNLCSHGPHWHQPRLPLWH